MSMTDNFKKWKPTEEQKQNMARDMQAIQSMLEYRSNEEGDWEDAQKKWNLITQVEKSMNIPIARMVTYTGIIAMTQSMPKIGIIPEDPDDNQIVDIIKDLNDHYDRLNGMPEVWEQVMTDYAVLGNGVIEDSIQYAYTLVRKKENGKWVDRYVRDLTQPKIVTRARSPWECAFEPGSRTVSNVRSCVFFDEITFAEYKELYGHGKSPLYMNTDCVQPGKVFLYSKDREIWDYEDKLNDRVVITHFQDERQDCYRIYANNVLIQDESLKMFHAHGKITLSLITNHHTYDNNLKRHRLYGKGDPFLLKDLHDYINAILNQFIRNYEAKTTNIVSVQGVPDISEIDLTSGAIINGDVKIQALGQADLNELEAVKNMIEEMVIQLAKKNYKRLEGEVAKTAYEARQKQQAENLGIRYQLNKIENVGLKAHYQKRVSDMMEYATEEEIVDVADLTIADEEAFKARYKESVKEYDKKGKPMKLAVREKFRTKGRAYSADKDRNTLSLVSEVEDGVLEAYPEFIQTKEFRLFKRIPEVYIVAGSSLGEDKEFKYEILQRAFQMSQAVEAAKMQFPEKNWDGFEDKALEYSDLNKEEIYGEVDPLLAESERTMNNIEDVLKTPTQQIANASIAGLAQANPLQPDQGASGGVPSPLATNGAAMA